MSDASVPPPAAEAEMFWSEVLLAGGTTTCPRWTRRPGVGTGQHEVALSSELEAAVGRLATTSGTTVETLVLAAHAKVLGVLTGEREVVTGFVPAPGRAALPCRLTTEAGSWQELVAATHRATAGLIAHRDFPLSGLRRALDVTGPSTDVVFDPAVTAAELPDQAVLRVGLASTDRLSLQLTFRAEALDADCAARIAGYHLTALSLMSAEPDAPHDARSLVSGRERELQLEELRGPVRPVPDLRLHELVEHRTKVHPDAVAAVHGEQRWTYRELNTRANRLGRALQAHGVGREDVVAVVMERNLDWMATVLAVFKAGGAYLPIEPHFPADRIATMLARAGCRLVVTEHGSTGTLDHAVRSLPHTQLLYAEDWCRHGRADDLGVAVLPDQLAYIYFTSGSTGEPKGAMCEHAGMLNHLYAKIDDLGIGEGHVVAQTAPQCFDISLWQLVAALLVGGTTLIVEQDVILDVRRFVRMVVDRRVTVLQLVPSYLDVVLSHLEQEPRDLSPLRAVSVTGEALKPELARRWFRTHQGIRLVNAYGLTETSDDTTHEVMERAPDQDAVPLGRPVNNVVAYVVDERLSLVPLGAPGLLAFSGVCVGRGYVNDPDRTRECYLPDPYLPGSRLYLSGDYGRWQADGTLAFLGRRDAQVKVAGFRIELGEIENALLRTPGVRDGAVVVRRTQGKDPQLIAFYTGDRPLATDALRARLGQSLPTYMLPAAAHFRAQLPLTDNGKIDRSALTRLADELVAAHPLGDPPRTASERRLAAAWAAVLGVAEPEIGRRDHFFDRGGTSLSAVKLAVTLDRAVSLQDITRFPVLSDLALVLDAMAADEPGPRRSAVSLDQQESR
jgi:amino acid adenylation domain-containing protein